MRIQDNTQERSQTKRQHKGHTQQEGQHDAGETNQGVARQWQWREKNKDRKCEGEKPRNSTGNTDKEI